MYLGNRSHHGAGRARSYADAQRILERVSVTATGKDRKPDQQGGFPLGLTKRGNTRVRQRSDGSIAFKLYNTDVVAYHPDGAIEIENFGTVTTSGFASQFLPAGFHLHFTSRNGGHTGIGYRNADNVPCLAFGGCGIFRPDERGYTPDADTISAVRFPRVVTAVARQVTRGLPWKDFDNWLSMAPRHLDIEHEGFDLDECVDALGRRDFRRAAETLPAIQDPGGFGLDRAIRRAAYPITVRGGGYITPGSVGKLKLAMYDDRGAVMVDVFPTIERDEFDKRMTLLRKLDSVGVNTTEWGPA